MKDANDNPEQKKGWADSASVAQEAFPEIDLARSRSVRLIVSIPVLAILLVLGSALSIYQYIEQNAPRTMLGPEAISRVRAANVDNPEAQQLLNDYLSFRNTTEQLTVSLLTVSVPLSLIAATVGFLLALQIVRPIRRLTTTMEAISRGDFSSKLQPINLGEFGELGSTFNRMVEQLNKLFEERDRQLRGSFEGAHLLVDRSGLVLQADGAAARLFYRKDKELVGSNLLLDSSPEANLSVARVRDILRTLIENAIQRKPESRAVTLGEGNDRRRILLSCSVLEGDREPRILVELRDISGIANFYEQIQRADRLAAVGTLATGIAHEIRNPLASIRGMAQLLAELADSETTGVLDYSNRIVREADRLEKLVRGIMDFAQSADSTPALTDVNVMLREVAEAVRHQLKNSENIGIVFDLDTELPMAYCQPDRIRQAVANLILNAVQHCRDKKLNPVRISTRHLDINAQRPVIIEISNPCEGLSDHDKERLFEPFYTTKADGTGLGLPIAFQTVAANGGILEVEFEDGIIQFWIRLPSDPDHSRRKAGILSDINAATPLPVSGRKP